MAVSGTHLVVSSGCFVVEYGSFRKVANLVFWWRQGCSGPRLSLMHDGQDAVEMYTSVGQTTVKSLRAAQSTLIGQLSAWCQIWSVAALGRSSNFGTLLASGSRGSVTAPH